MVRARRQQSRGGRRQPLNLAPGAPSWLLALLFAALVAAAIEDLIRLRISNVTCLVVFLSALIAMALHGFSLDLWQNAAVFIVLLFCGTLLFAANKMGGGDIKLLASLGLWMNVRAGVALLASSLIAGGVLALIYIAARRLRGDRSKTSKGIPYGIAIVAGTCFILAGQLGWIGTKSGQPPALTVRPLR